MDYELMIIELSRLQREAARRTAPVWLTKEDKEAK